VLSAYCPHLGANLGVGGKVCGESIECPFHGWRFGNDGRCTKVPGQDSIPEVAKVRAWPVIERNNMILVWFHVDEKEPDWEPPVMPEIDNNEFVRHSHAVYTINVHNQDIFENGGDVAHLSHLHSSLFPSIAKYFHNEWEASYQPGTKENGDAHIAHITVVQDQYITPFGSVKLRLSHVKSEIQQVGPGLVYARLHSPVGFVFVFETVTPKEALEQEVRLTFWTPPSVPRFLAKFVVWGYLRAFEQDLAIWNNKTHVAKPIFSRSDKMIPPLRRWSQQFFSENSHKAHARLHPLEW
jgi:cholesterol 7-desaturase